MCHGGCGVLLRIENGRLLDIRGDPEAPANRGRLCPKGMATLELIYHPDRVTRPLKRTGARGAGLWETIAWDQALAEITDRIKSLIAAHGRETIALGQGTGRHHYLEVIRFANALGAPNVIEPGAAQCYFPRVTTSMLTYGDFPVGDYYGSTPPRCILCWGSNPVVSGADGKVCFAVERALAQAEFSIAVDPRRSETARRCKLHLPLRPGSDAALALAMLHVMITERLYDADFVTQWTSGFEELRTTVQAYPPEWAAPLTWIAPELIRQAARIYARNKPGILEWGVAFEQNTNSLQTARALALLRALSGNLDIPGGDLLGMHLLRTPPVNRGIGVDELISKRLGADRFRLLGGKQAHIRMAHAPTLFHAMVTGQPYPVTGFLVFGNNPLTTYANPDLVRKALLHTQLLVVTDFFKTPTAELADYILPAAAWPELDDVVALPYIAENVLQAQQKLVQVDECWPDEKILTELALRLQLPYTDTCNRDALNRRLSRTGITFERLCVQGSCHPPHEYRKYMKQGFRTPSKKVELFCSTLKDLGYDPLPVYLEPPESPFSAPQIRAEYPYVLITGARRRHVFHSEGRQLASLRRIQPDPQVELNPETAAAHKIAPNDWVRVSSSRGAGRFRARLTPDLPPEVVALDHGWWFPETPGPDHGVMESNANRLTQAGPPYDPAFGSCQLRGLLCRIEKEPA